MKKLKLIPVCLLIICLLCCIFTACGKKLLDSPTGFSVNDEYRLSWLAIRNARSYTIKITSEEGESKEHSSRRAYYSLSNLEEGDYVISVKAISGSNEYGDSEWSDDFEFKKDYESGCIYTLINNNTEYEVSRVGTANGIVVLGDTYRNKPVTSIADSAFKGSGRVEKIVIGKNVKTIGEAAFYNCTKLKEIEIPESVTQIGTSAFHNCNQLETINLPSGYTVIEPYTFRSCRSLLNITLPNVTTIGENAFASCASLLTIEVPDTVVSIGENAFISCKSLTSVSIGSGVETIGVGAFYGCESLNEVSFSENGKLTTIKEEAFRKCSSLEILKIPEGVSDLGDRIFYECEKLDSIDLPDTLMHVGVNAFGGTKIYSDSVAKGQFVYADGWLVSWTGTFDLDVRSKLTKLDKTVLDNSDIVGIADQVFIYSLLLSLDLPDTVRAIGKYAFAFSNLTRVYTYENNATLKSDLRLIDEFAFRDCKLLNRLFLNDGLETINRYAFYNCSDLVNNSTSGISIIPSSVTSIGTGVFNKTKLYEDAKDVVYAGDWVVGYKGTGNSSVMLSGLEDLPVRGISDYAFYKSENIRSVSLASSSANTLRYIGRGAFSGCTNLSAVSFSRQLERVEDYTFYKCASLFKVSFTPRLKSIGRSAFYGCVILDEVDLSESQVSQIGAFAFYNCKNIKKLNLGDSLQQIEERAFYKCLSIESLNIPDSVTIIGERAFYQCEGLKSLSLGNGTKVIGNSAFSGCSAIDSLTIPDSVIEIGNYAFYKCSGITSLKLGSGLKQIGNYAFAYLPLITSLYMPQSVETIGRYAFMRCSSLNSITLNSAELALDTFSFYGCVNMTVYTDVSNLPENWHARWNASFRPVIWGCKLSDDGSFVVSLTVGEDTFSNPKAINGISAPKREGYLFKGWSAVADASEGEYDTAELINLETGTTVYAVWQAAN